MPRYNPTAAESEHAARSLHWSRSAVREHLAAQVRHFEAAERAARAAMTAGDRLHQARQTASLWGESL